MPFRWLALRIQQTLTKLTIIQHATLSPFNIIIFYIIKLILLPIGYCFNDYFQIIIIYCHQLLLLVKSLQVMSLHCIWSHGMNCTFLVTPIGVIASFSFGVALTKKVDLYPPFLY